MKLAQLAAATVSIISQGPADMEISSAAGLDLAGPGDVTFLANPKYTPQIKGTKASAIFVNETVEIERNDIAVLRAKDAYVAYTLALRLFFPTPQIVPGIHPSAVVDETATVASDVEIQANVVVGKNCVIESGKISKLGLPVVVPVTEFRDIIGTALTAMLSGADPATELKKASEQYKPILEKSEKG